MRGGRRSRSVRGKETFARKGKNRHNSLRMVQLATSDGGTADTREEYLKAFRWMLLARLLDDKFASLYRGGKIHGGGFLSRGPEALRVAVGQTLRKGDVFAPPLRHAAGRRPLGRTGVDTDRPQPRFPPRPKR